MAISEKIFGSLSDEINVKLYKITNSSGAYVELINYGATIRSIVVPDKNGTAGDVVLGYDTLDGYLHKNPYHGALIGRFANRIENSCFELNGIKYELYANNGKNHLHGGKKGFDKVIWDTEIIDNSSLKMTYTSPDGEEEYPGTLKVDVTYTFNDENALLINYKAISDKDTVINLTNHSYFNLTGNQSISIENHLLWIDSQEITTSNEQSIPTGDYTNVSGTPFDFNIEKPIGRDIDEENQLLKWAGGYDHNFVLNTANKKLTLFAKATENESGRVMEVYTNKPGVQLYTGNYLTNEGIGKRSEVFSKRSGFCLETQFYPNSIKYTHFPSPVLKAGETYDYTTIYKFSLRNG
jgi:aldose 1-epimerase